jgi:hypothetical protein
MAILFVAASTQTIAFGSGSSVAQNVTAVTLMGWYKPTSLPATQCDIIGFSNGTAAGSSRCKIATLTTGAIQANGRCLDADTNQTYATATGQVSAGNWYHIAATFNYSTKVITIYKNGAYVSNSAAVTWGAAPTSNTASLSMNIGSQHNGGTEYADGVIEDARAYNRLLNAAEIQTIYYSIGADQITYGLQHRYLLREGGIGTTVSASAGSVKDMGNLQKNNSSQVNNPTYRDGRVTELAIDHGT